MMDVSLSARVPQTSPLKEEFYISQIAFQGHATRLPALMLGVFSDSHTSCRIDQA